MAKFRGKYSINIAGGDTWPSVCRIFPDACEVTYGVDPQRFQVLPDSDRSRIKRRLGFADDQVVLLFVGRLIAIKNLPFLIKGFTLACDSNPDLRLLMVGSGPDEAHLKELVRNLGIADRVVWAGVQFGADLVAMYNAGDIFAICSKYESFSAVTLEAMAVNLPVIATRVGNLPQIVKQNENGLLIELNNLEELKTAILRLASNKEMRQTMGIVNREKVINNYRWNDIGIKLSNRFNEVLN
jgi:glycosyltransferase involved in cell wall biosynthesis